METIELFSIPASMRASATARAALEALGFTVVEKLCPPSTADWVEFPFIREPSGSAYYGAEGIAVFLGRMRRQRYVTDLL